jgi:hypothetical protein
MNKEIRKELYKIMENKLSHSEITHYLDILEKLDFTKEQYNDKDYLRHQLDNIIEY